MGRFKTSFDPKPIPIRKFDHIATTDDYEPGHPSGYGATRDDALRDLGEQFVDLLDD
jgi:hypothetical protein